MKLAGPSVKPLASPSPVALPSRRPSFPVGRVPLCGHWPGGSLGSAAGGPSVKGRGAEARRGGALQSTRRWLALARSGLPRAEQDWQTAARFHRSAESLCCRYCTRCSTSASRLRMGFPPSAALAPVTTACTALLHHPFPGLPGRRRNRYLAVTVALILRRHLPLLPSRNGCLPAPSSLQPGPSVERTPPPPPIPLRTGLVWTEWVTVSMGLSGEPEREHAQKDTHAQSHGRGPASRRKNGRPARTGIRRLAE